MLIHSKEQKQTVLVSATDKVHMAEITVTFAINNVKVYCIEHYTIH